VRAGGEDTLSTVIGAAYPVGDVIMAALVVVLLTRAAPSNRTSLLLLSAGLVLLAVADSLFMYGTSTNSYASGGLLDLGWFAGFLAVGLSGLAMGASPLSRTRHVAVSRRRLALPYVPAGIAMLIVFANLFQGQSLHLVEVLSALAIVVAVAARQFLVMTDNRDLLAALEAGEEEVGRRGLTDPLTGLATGTLFEDRLQQSLRRANRDGQPRAILVVDVDDFGVVNRSLGDAAADEVLVEVAERLRRTVRTADSIARIHDDEFAVLLEAGHRAPDHIAQRVVDNLRTVVDVGGEPVPITVSVGLLVERTRRLDTVPAELIAGAERAVRQAKAAGKDRFVAAADDVPYSLGFSRSL
jgi:diguanylate cyclase (GGDEF)-like protein